MMKNKILTPVLASVEAEQSIIGGLLLDNTAWANLGSLKPEMFYVIAHRAIFAVLAEMLSKGKAVDVIVLSEALQERGELDKIGGLPYLITIAQNTPSAANIRRYAEIVRERHANRRLLAVGQEIAELATEQKGRDLAERQATAMRLLMSATEEGIVSETVNSFDATASFLQHFEAKMNAPEGQLLGFSTGIKALDLALQGLRRSELVVIGGRPSMGKSVLAENIARHCAKTGLSVYFQSYEMPANDLVARGASAECGIDYKKIRKARLNSPEFVALTEYIAQRAEWRFFINGAGLTLEQIAAEARALKVKNGLDLLVIDHLHLMPLAGKKPQHQELNEITSSLKRLAMELNICVLLLAQLSRESERRNDKRPMMSDLRESGGIEQDANVVIFPFRPAYHDSDANPTEAELIIAKNRDGERGTLHVGWQGEYQRFTNQSDPSALPQRLQESVENSEEWVS